MAEEKGEGPKARGGTFQKGPSAGAHRRHNPSQGCGRAKG